MGASLRHRLSTAAVLFVPFIGTVSPLVAQSAGDEVDRPQVAKLVLRGVKAVDAGELRHSIATQASHCKGLLFQPFCLFSKSHYFYEREYLDRAEFQRDVLRIRVFYFKRGYRETQVDTSVAGDRRVTVTFRVAEGPPTVVSRIRVLRPEGILTRRQVRRVVRLRRDQPFDLFKLDSSVVRLREALWDRGYGDAVVADSSVVDSTRRAQVVFITDPKARTVVGDIHLTGNRDVSDETIHNSLSLKPGDLYRERERVSSQRSLYESGLFKRAEVRVESDSLHPGPDSVKALHVVVTETPPRAARVSGGFNTVDFFQVQGRYTQYNLLGGAGRLDVIGTVGNLFAEQLNGRGIFRDVTIVEGSDRSAFLAPTYQASADVQQRWFGNPHNTLGVGIFGHRRSAPGVFIDRGYGAHTTFTRSVAERAPLSADYRFEITRVDAGEVYFCVNFGVCDTTTINTLQSQQRLSPVTLTGSLDRSDDPFTPRRGYRARADLQHASAFTLSDFRYNRAFGEASAYFPVLRRAVLATRARVGWVKALSSTAEATGALGAGTSLLHPRTRFYAGGSQSVRGYGENQLGPRILTISPVRLREDTAGCPRGLAIENCNPRLKNAKGEYNIPNSDFTPRPLGGSTLLEGSVEFRFPVWQALSGAVFLDGAFVGEGSLSKVTTGSGALTPGFGVRYKSPVGPIRVDLGINPTTGEQLQVVTEDDSFAEGTRRPLVTLKDQTRAIDEKSGLLSRLTLHLSIGEAF
jgi:outer membrane protein assembly factor BamA